MLLEFKVWGSTEWYERAVPMLEDFGLVPRPELSWADPETDGELMGLYFDYEDTAALSAFDLCEVLARVRGIVEAGEAPGLEVNIVSSLRKAVAGN